MLHEAARWIERLEREHLELRHDLERALANHSADLSVASHERKPSESRIAEDAIDLFLEYRDKHGHDEEAAKVHALIEFDQAEALSVAPTEEPIGYALEAAHWRLMKHCYGEVEDVQVGYAIKAIEERIGVNGIENVPASPSAIERKA